MGAIKRQHKFVHAVDNVSFEIMKGEILGIVGESGCGKSTTGRLMVRLDSPTAGDIFFKTPQPTMDRILALERFTELEERFNKQKAGKGSPAVDMGELEKQRQEARYAAFGNGTADLASAKKQLADLRSKNSISALKGKYLKTFRRNVQMVFQDPYESLNPRFTVFDTVSEPLIVHRVGETIDEREELVCRALENAGLKPAVEYLARFPHELSGGQRQRVAIARALVLRPEFIVADEPVSMLDVSIRAGIMNLMLDLREKFGIPYMFITHDVSVARYMSDRIGVMYLGRMVEIGPTEEIINNAQHPYTRALLSAVPVPDPNHKHGEVEIKGELPSPIDLPKGCRFCARCLYATDYCKTHDPQPREAFPSHFVQCHYDISSMARTI